MKKVKVLLISEVFYPEIGSGSTRITNILTHLKKRGYEVDILTSYPNYPNRDLYKNSEFWDKELEKEILGESTIYRVNPSRLRPTSNFINRLYIYKIFLLKSIIKILTIGGEYDLVIATIPSVFMGILGIIAKLKFKCKYIVDIRDLWPECLKGIGVFKNVKGALEVGYFLEKIILKYSDSATINSNAFREYLISKGYKKTIEFIPNGLNEKDLMKYKNIMDLKKATEEKENEFLIIYTGMIGLPQNLRSVVKAANLLKDYENIKFKLIGTGIQVGRVNELIDHYELKNIVLLNPMTKEKVLREVEKSSLTIFNLRGDSRFDLVMPGKIIDYMSMKKPMVAGVEGYTKKIIETSNSGIVVGPDDYKAMAEAIKSMYYNEEKRKIYGENGYKYCKENFLWSKNIIVLDKLINMNLGREINEESVHVCMESLH